MSKSALTIPGFIFTSFAAGWSGQPERLTVVLYVWVHDDFKHVELFCESILVFKFTAHVLIV